jgi:hypothetical protein
MPWPTGMGSLEVLTAMITPAVLISASGTLVLSTSNRLSRVVDRVRTIAKEAAALQRNAAEVAGQRAANATEAAGQRAANAAEVAGQRAFIVRQVRTLTARVTFLRTALTVLYAAIGMFIATSIAVGIVSALGVEAGWLPVTLALIGAGALLYASALLVREARLAVITTLEETAALEASISGGERED